MNSLEGSCQKQNWLWEWSWISEFQLIKHIRTATDDDKMNVEPIQDKPQDLSMNKSAIENSNKLTTTGPRNGNDIHKNQTTNHIPIKNDG